MVQVLLGLRVACTALHAVPCAVLRLCVLLWLHVQRSRSAFHYAGPLIHSLFMSVRMRPLHMTGRELFLVLSVASWMARRNTVRTRVRNTSSTTTTTVRTGRQQETLVYRRQQETLVYRPSTNFWTVFRVATV